MLIGIAASLRPLVGESVCWALLTQALAWMLPTSHVEVNPGTCKRDAGFFLVAFSLLL
jgi:hypothetical protein